MLSKAMSRLGRLWRNLRRRAEVERELNEEFEAYVEMLTAANIRGGMSPAAARRVALAATGGVEQLKENVREVRMGYAIETLYQDLRYGARLLRRSPMFAAVIVATLALGIGANTAIFSVVNSAVLRPLPFSDPGRLIAIGKRSSTDPFGPISEEDVARWRSRAHTLQGLESWTEDEVNITGHGEPERLHCGEISGGLLTLLGVNPLAGRIISPSDDKPGQEHVVMLAERFWERRFQRSPSIVGQAITLDGQSYTVAGIAPRSLGLFESFDVLVTMTTLHEKIERAGEDYTQFVNVVGKLKPGFTPSHVADELNEIRRQDQPLQRSLPQSGPLPPPPTDLAVAGGSPQPAGPARAAASPSDQSPNDGPGDQWRRQPELQPGEAPPVGGPSTFDEHSVSAIPLSRYILGDTRMALLVLLAAVSFVLLIACVNVANLLLARAAGRQTEIAIRASLGAGRWRLIRQLMVESIMLALLGGAAGVALVAASAKTLAVALPGTIAEQVHGAAAAGLDREVLGFALLLTLITGVIFGLAPAIAGSKTNLEQSLKHAGRRTTAGLGPRSLRGSLVIAEIALSLVLLVGAGLMIKSFIRLRQTPIGFRPAGLLTMAVTLPDSKYRQASQVSGFFNQVVDRVQSLGGVRSVGVTDALPLGGIWMMGAMEVEGYERPDKAPGPLIPMAQVGPGYFSTMGIPIIRGRSFSDVDPVESVGPGLEQANAAPQGPVIVNQTFARSYWPNSDPIGKHVRGQQVVGVVGDYKQHVSSATKPQVYINAVGRRMCLAILCDSSPRSLIAAVRAQIAEVDPDQPLDEIKTMDEQLAGAIAEPRFYTALFGAFAAMSLLLAAIGIYGVISYSVSAGTHEIGIRLALGLSRSGVLRMVLRDAMMLSGIGIVIGVAGAIALTRWMSSYLYQVDPRDLPTLIITAVALGAVAVIACLAPARRAARLDPMVALRYE